MSKRNLNLNIISFERKDGADLLVGIKAPGRRRDGRHLQIVLDIGESMNPAKLFPALRGLHYLLGELGEKDTFGLITLGVEARVAFPAGPVTDVEELHEMFSGVRPFGPSEPTAGLLTAIRECQRIGARAAAIVLISDSNLNCATPRESQMIVGMAEASREQGFRVSTISMERKQNPLLAKIAREGGGRSSKVTDGGDMSRALAKAQPGLANKPIRSLNLTFRASPDVTQVSLLDPRPTVELDDDITVELGDLRDGEALRLTFKLDIPDLAELGHSEVGEVELQWTDFRTMSIESVKTTVHVNCPPDGTGGGSLEFDTKMDLSGSKDPREKSTSSRGTTGRPEQRQKKPRRALPGSIRAQIAQTVRGQVRSEVERQLREHQAEQPDEPQTVRPDSGEDSQ